MVKLTSRVNTVIRKVGDTIWTMAKGIEIDATDELIDALQKEFGDRFEARFITNVSVPKPKSEPKKGKDSVPDVPRATQKQSPNMKELFGRKNKDNDKYKA